MALYTIACLNSLKNQILCIIEKYQGKIFWDVTVYAMMLIGAYK